MNRFLIISCLVILTFLAGLSLAGIPQMINYQGMLTDNSGNPLNGTYSITFKIYNAESDGTKRWEETQPLVSVTNGLFNVILGSVTPINLDFSEDYWLDITVAGETMPTRLKFTSVGYAYRAQKADTADYAHAGGDGDDDWTVNTTDGTLITGGEWGIARRGNVLLGNQDSTHVNFGVACTTGSIDWNSSSCTVGGGTLNTASRSFATVAGGYSNTASAVYAIVAGGYDNTASVNATTVGGGSDNTASGSWATVVGGDRDTASGEGATVSGGGRNVASGEYSIVSGGKYNSASGSYSFASGFRAKANHDGAFVWADYTIADFASTKTHQFSIRAGNGVRLASDAGPSKTIDIGERYRDNGIVAWGKVSSGGTLSADFGVTSVTNDSAGTYTVTLDATSSDAATLIPIAQAEVEAPGTIRIVSINQTSTKVFEVYINNNSFNRVNNDFVFMVTAR